MGKVLNRVGECKLSNQGSLMKIVEYNSATEVVVEFQDYYKYRTRTDYGCFKRGGIKNPYYKSLFKVGYLGLASAVSNGEIKQSYSVWHGLISRCYSEWFLKKSPTYKECYVCDEWLCFENFDKWWNENYYEVEGQKMNLDKDILFKGNKIYSPQTSVIVPREINTLFLKEEGHRGELPIGVTFQSSTGRYAANCKVGGKLQYLGGYKTIQEAFEVYKEYKENVIKEYANKYKGIIPNNLYEAMMNYEVEISD